MKIRTVYDMKTTVIEVKNSIDYDFPKKKKDINIFIDCTIFR